MIAAILLILLALACLLGGTALLVLALLLPWGDRP
jgi:hypothetical protein